MEEKLNTEEEQKHLSCFLRLLWRCWMMSNMDLQTGSRLVPGWFLSQTDGAELHLSPEASSTVGSCST